MQRCHMPRRWLPGEQPLDALLAWPGSIGREQACWQGRWQAEGRTASLPAHNDSSAVPCEVYTPSAHPIGKQMASKGSAQPTSDGCGHLLGHLHPEADVAVEVAHTHEGLRGRGGKVCGAWVWAGASGSRPGCQQAWLDVRHCS